MISDLAMELTTGEWIELPSSFVLAPGLPGIGGADNGDRAPDSDVVVRSGDELPTTYSVPVPGVLQATSQTALLDSLQLFSDQLMLCRKLWRADRRCFMYVAYALLPPPLMRQGWLSCEATPIFRLARLGWFTPEGKKVFG